MKKKWGGVYFKRLNLLTWGCSLNRVQAESRSWDPNIRELTDVTCISRSKKFSFKFGDWYM